MSRLVEPVQDLLHYRRLRLDGTRNSPFPTCKYWFLHAVRPQLAAARNEFEQVLRIASYQKTESVVEEISR